MPSSWETTISTGTSQRDLSWPSPSTNDSASDAVAAPRQMARRQQRTMSPMTPHTTSRNQPARLASRGCRSATASMRWSSESSTHKAHAASPESAAAAMPPIAAIVAPSRGMKRNSRGTKLPATNAATRTMALGAAQLAPRRSPTKRRNCCAAPPGPARSWPSKASAAVRATSPPPGLASTFSTVPGAARQKRPKANPVG
mmetsp:Transcript_134765/g.430641  ORF Transcript_134765/g.430641 Transcript_134765/m.430641 type:complete len:200 (-) Transcript_134765:576-1175(-)